MAAINSVSLRSPSFGHLSVTIGTGLFGIGILHFQKAKPKKAASTAKMEANKRYRKTFDLNGFLLFGDFDEVILGAVDKTAPGEGTQRIDNIWIRVLSHFHPAI